MLLFPFLIKGSRPQLLLALSISIAGGVMVLGVGIACLVAVKVYKRKKRRNNDEHVYEDVSLYELTQHYEMKDNDAYTHRVSTFTTNPEITDHAHAISYSPVLISHNDPTDSNHELEAVDETIHGCESTEGSKLDISVSENVQLQGDSQERDREASFPNSNSYEQPQTYAHVQTYEQVQYSVQSHNTCEELQVQRRNRQAGTSILSQDDDTSDNNHDFRENASEYGLVQTYEQVQSYEQIRAALDQLPPSQPNCQADDDYQHNTEAYERAQFYEQATGAYERIQRYETLQSWMQAPSTHAINAARLK